jgi:hypothetical protein
MPKIQSVWKGKDKWTPLVPVGRVRLGDKVWWLHTYWLGGYPTSYHRIGLVEAKRGKVCLVRDRYGHTAEMEVSKLLKPET